MLHKSPHRVQHPRNLQQHQLTVRQTTLIHQHVFHFKKTHIHLKKDIQYYRTFRTCSSPLTLSEPHFEPTHNIYPSLQQIINRTIHPSQNQNTSTINRKIVHPGRNRNFTTPRDHFNKPSSPTPNPLDLSSSTIQSNPHHYNLAQNRTFRTYHRTT